MKNKKGLKLHRFEFIIAIFFIAILCFETVGFALFSELLSLNGNVILEKDGKFEITSIVKMNANNITESRTPSFNGTNIDFSFSVTTRYNTTSNIRYKVTLTNNSSFNREFRSIDVNTTSSGNNRLNYAVTGINEGEVIRSHESKVFYITYSITSNSIFGGNFNATSNVVINSRIGDGEGSLYGSLDSGVADLTDNKNAVLSFNVINTRGSNIDFSLVVNSDRFELKSSNSYSINSNSSNSFEFTIGVKDGALLSSEHVSIPITLTYLDGKVSNVGTIYASVTSNTDIDSEPPIISNVVGVKNSTEGSIDVSWNATDDSEISRFYIQAYSCDSDGENSSLVDTYSVSGDKTSITLTDLNYGYYYFVVYGIDANGNDTPFSDIAKAGVDSVYASRSAVSFYRWVVNVTFELTNVTSTGEYFANYLEDYSFNLAASGLLSGLPNSISVRVGNTTLVNNQGFTYNNNTGAVLIRGQYVTDDITISVEASCLAEGTLIKLANGDYKKIEDITYYDLLAVWDYDTGKLSYEYPIWIEKKHSSDNYKLIKFSDGSSLKVIGYHGLYDYDKKMFISTADSDNFKVGVRTLKLNNNNKLEVVAVTSIEDVYENVNYYHVVSTRYYNIFANNLLTTDGNATLSNIYNYDENVKWVDNKNTNPLSYDSFKDFVPYYLYLGLRMEDASLLVSNNNDFVIFKEYLLSNQLNDKLIKKIPNIMGKNIVKVSINDEVFYALEGDSFIIPRGTYLNTSDNKYYTEGDVINIYLNTHFIRIK